MKQDMIVILDLGSTSNAYLARDIRAAGVYSEIYSHTFSKSDFEKLSGVKGIILNGGTNNIYQGKEVDVLDEIYSLGVPVTANNFNKAKCPSLTDLNAFLFDTCKCEKNWNAKNFIDDQVELLRKQIGNDKVLLALSGGVDSSVVAALLIKAIGKNLTCVHVNHGLLRKGEPEQVIKVFGEELGADLIYVDATDRYLDKLAGVDNPEEKRKIIGKEFIDIFEEEAKKLNGIKFLGQGTIYPDIIESGTLLGKPVKAHHNVGGLPEKLGFELVEPLKFLFKDEVRAVGHELGLPDNMVYRQPFPGPGLGVRCVGAITRDRLEALREADAILREEFDIAGLRGKVWQYFTIVPPIKSVGVRNNERSEEWMCVIRAVNTVDAMTAEVPHIDWEILHKITKRIINEVKGINRVLFDLSPKPTATIEWE